MKIVILERLLLIILLIVVVDLVIKLNKFLSVERRISRYSVDSLMDNQGSIGDKLKIRYERFILKNRKNVICCTGEGLNVLSSRGGRRLFRIRRRGGTGIRCK